MRKIVTMVSAAIGALVVTAAPLRANHGLTGTIDGVLVNGTVVHADLEYLGGNFDTQTWYFTWEGLPLGPTFGCEGFGSVEVGFTSVDCSTPFSTGGVGHFHEFPYCDSDIHQIPIGVGGVAGVAALQIIHPDC